mmetsp:Transcript_7719/g.13606  ORF Transcript_7719/g.13606 Transcript_7719/m.13606 type:complete len:243 (+) Transcript_7719:300-1028(+)
MVALSSSSSGEDGIRPVVNRRQLLVKVGSWVKYSWRKSKESLLSLDDDNEDRPTSPTPAKIPKTVKFEDDEALVTEIPTSNGDNDYWCGALSEEEIKLIWYQDYDYKRFEKDRVLTSMDYSNARKVGKTFVEDSHSVRGIEYMCDENLQRQQSGERRGLHKALWREELKQKDDGSFPDLERFRAVSLKYTKDSKERAFVKACEDAREQQREMRRTSSMKNLFLRARNSAGAGGGRRRRQSIG